jgi:hypothetical protein
MIGPSSTFHQYWQRINLIGLGFALGLIFYAPRISIFLGGALFASGLLEARFDKREVA